MYWFSTVVMINEEPNILVSYYHINPVSKVLEVHTKVAKDQKEFELYYEKVKSL